MDTQMINFSIPRTLLRNMDRVAEEESRNRSEFLREAIRQYIQERKERKQDFALMRRSAQRINMKEEEAIRLIDEIRDTLPMNRNKSRPFARTVRFNTNRIAKRVRRKDSCIKI